MRGLWAHKTRTCPSTGAAASGPETAITRSPCVTRAVPSWIHRPPACSTVSRTRSMPIRSSWLPPIARTDATSWSLATSSPSLPNSEEQSTRSPPSSTTSGSHPATASNTCRHSVSERPFLRWMSLTYSSRHASCRAERRSSRTCRARRSPMSSDPPNHGRFEFGSCAAHALDQMNTSECVSDRSGPRPRLACPTLGHSPLGLARD